MQLNILCVAARMWTTPKNINTGNTFDASHDRNKNLQQAHITELVEMMSNVFTLCM